MTCPDGYEWHSVWERDFEYTTTDADGWVYAFDMYKLSTTFRSGNVVRQCARWRLHTHTHTHTDGRGGDEMNMKKSVDVRNVPPFEYTLPVPYHV